MLCIICSPMNNRFLFFLLQVRSKSLKSKEINKVFIQFVSLVNSSPLLEFLEGSGCNDVMGWTGLGDRVGWGGGGALQSFDQSTNCYLTLPWRSCNTERTTHKTIFYIMKLQLTQTCTRCSSSLVWMVHIVPCFHIIYNSCPLIEA